ncbi:hypothetical protein JR316_0011979 [Psilocybe cubensis]|uniref:Uncharacterized protein n=2 Tax=Psilocybe cubensis TaxID=181762 RepID=A0ACB8GMY1_PSICU|nr:hypothetical protein JR316_0011979 [Psilocybe cubensis]KAH9476404.1 hypothetical protein JR316_0011979 [Psilocybe cubensis]
MPATRNTRRATPETSRNVTWETSSWAIEDTDEQTPKPRRSDPCIYCGKVLSRQSDMKRHMARYGPKNFKCPECPFASHTSCGLRVHYRTKHTDEKDDCPFDDCPYGSGDPSSLHRHKRSAHPEFVPAPRAATIPISQPDIVQRGSTYPQHHQYSVFRAWPRPSDTSSTSIARLPSLHELDIWIAAQHEKDRRARANC